MIPINKDGLKAIYPSKDLEQEEIFAELLKEKPEMFQNVVALEFEMKVVAQNTTEYLLYQLTRQGLDFQTRKALFKNTYQSNGPHESNMLNPFWVFITEDGYTNYIEAILNGVGIGTRK